MRLTVLGTSGAYPGPGSACSGYLLEAEGFRLVVDLGTGALANLLRHVGYDEVDALALSHQHLDHCIDLYPLFMARYFHPGPLRPLPLVAPEGAFERVARLQGTETAEMRQFFDARVVEPGATFELGPFRVETVRMRHPVSTIGMRVHHDGAVLAYTADTGPGEEVDALARDADVLVAEASWLRGQEQGDFHLSAGQAGAHAARAGVRRLVLSHFWPTNDREASRAQAAEAFGGDLVIAHEGLSVEVGP